VEDEPTDREEQFVQFFTRHERDLRVFIRSTGLDWVAVDDVLQSVGLVIWRKWDQFDPETNFMQWARVIARFEVLKYRRDLARDRHVFREDVMELLAEASEELDRQTQQEDYRNALQQCLQALPRRSGELIRSVYADDRPIRTVAQDTGKTATALYKTLNRIREQLRKCIRQRLRTTT